MCRSKSTCASEKKKRNLNPRGRTYLFVWISSIFVGSASRTAAAASGRNRSAGPELHSCYDTLAYDTIVPDSGYNIVPFPEKYQVDDDISFTIIIKSINIISTGHG